MQFSNVSSAAYRSLRFRFILMFEEGNNLRFRPYIDSVGLVTIGMGFNIEGNSAVLDAVLDEFGIADSETSVRQDIRSAISRGSTDAGVRSALDAIMSQRSQTIGGRSTFSFTKVLSV